MSLSDAPTALQVWCHIAGHVDADVQSQTSFTVTLPPCMTASGVKALMWRLAVQAGMLMDRKICTESSARVLHYLETASSVTPSGQEVEADADCREEADWQSVSGRRRSASGRFGTVVWQTGTLMVNVDAESLPTAVPAMHLRIDSPDKSHHVKLWLRAMPCGSAQMFVSSFLTRQSQNSSRARCIVRNRMACQNIHTASSNSDKRKLLRTVHGRIMHCYLNGLRVPDKGSTVSYDKLWNLNTVSTVLGSVGDDADTCRLVSVAICV